MRKIEKPTTRRTGEPTIKPEKELLPQPGIPLRSADATTETPQRHSINAATSVPSLPALPTMVYDSRVPIQGAEDEQTLVEILTKDQEEEEPVSEEEILDGDLSGHSRTSIIMKSRGSKEVIDTKKKVTTGTIKSLAHIMEAPDLPPPPPPKQKSPPRGATMVHSRKNSVEPKMELYNKVILENEVKKAASGSRTTYDWNLYNKKSKASLLSEIKSEPGQVSDTLDMDQVLRDSTTIGNATLLEGDESDYDNPQEIRDTAPADSDKTKDIGIKPSIKRTSEVGMTNGLSKTSNAKQQSQMQVHFRKSLVSAEQKVMSPPTTRMMTNEDANRIEEVPPTKATQYATASNDQGTGQVGTQAVTHTAPYHTEMMQPGVPLEPSPKGVDVMDDAHGDDRRQSREPYDNRSVSGSFVADPNSSRKSKKSLGQRWSDGALSRVSKAHEGVGGHRKSASEGAIPSLHNGGSEAGDAYGDRGVDIGSHVDLSSPLLKDQLYQIASRASEEDVEMKGVTERETKRVIQSDRKTDSQTNLDT